MVNLLKNERQIEILKKRKARFKKLLYYAKGSSNMELHLRGGDYDNRKRA